MIRKGYVDTDMSAQEVYKGMFKELNENIKKQTFEDPLIMDCIEEFFEAMEIAKNKVNEETIERQNKRIEQLNNDLDETKKKLNELREVHNNLRKYTERLEGWYGNLQVEVDHYKDMYESLKGILNQKGF